MSLDELLKQRAVRIHEIEALGYHAYGKRYDFSHTIPEILAEYGAIIRRPRNARDPPAHRWEIDDAASHG